MTKLARLARLGAALNECGDDATLIQLRALCEYFGDAALECLWDHKIGAVWRVVIHGNNSTSHFYTTATEAIYATAKRLYDRDNK